MSALCSFGRTKIVATLGPATASVSRMREVINQGVDCFRLNFSHGEYSEKLELISNAREASAAEGQNVALLMDLCGPKIRTGKLTGGHAIMLEKGERFTISTDTFVGGGLERDQKRVSTIYKDLHKDVKKHDRVLLSDGLIEMFVVGVSGKEVLCEVVNGGKLKESQGINLPGVNVSAACLTAKDENDLKFGIGQGVDYVAVSFVKDHKDVLHAQDLVSRFGGKQLVVPKIERPEALDDISAIVRVASGACMVARGDLGVELNPADVPLAQKRIIFEAQRVGLPTIVATQMLESMIVNPRPTRAEASDVHNAVMDGADAIMLSGETAVGKFPVECVTVMGNIIRSTEEGYLDLIRMKYGTGDHSNDDSLDISGSIAAAASFLSKKVDLKAILTFSYSGTTAMKISRGRPPVPVIALSPNADVCRRLSIVYGLMPFVVPKCESARELTHLARQICLEKGIAKVGDWVVMTGSHPVTDVKAPPNFLKIIQI